MSSRFGSEHWSEGLKLVSYCPVCETQHHPMSAKMLGERNETQLLHVQCKKCLHSVLALVLVNSSGASSVGLLTDLSYEDVERFCQTSPLSVDDVISAHNLFSSGDWQRLLDISQRQRVAKTLKRQAKKKQNTNTTS